ncbi:MAG: TetR/AcrR family transcriptional regulator [Chloroflexi bacterium]|nr:TetR/AcrR family transcriptional regulator [Chloroflexota bacterium]
MLVTSKVANEGLLAERHEQLIAAATQLFLENGFHKTSVREIAAAAGWRMGTLYLYITRKEDVLYLIVKTIMTELAGVIDNTAPHATARETFYAAADYYFKTAARMTQELQLVYREWASLLPEHALDGRARETPVVEFFAEIIQRGIEAGEFAPVDPKLVAYDVIHLAHFWAVKQATLGPMMSFDAYREQQIGFLLTFLLHGPAAPATDDAAPTLSLVEDVRQEGDAGSVKKVHALNGAGHRQRVPRSTASSATPRSPRRPRQ